MNSQKKEMIEYKENFLRKLVKNIRNLLFNLFEKKSNDLIQQESVHKDDVNENNEQEKGTLERLNKLLEENKLIEHQRDIKLEELKKIRIEELKLTLKIYQLEEVYLRGYIKKIK